MRLLEQLNFFNKSVDSHNFDAARFTLASLMVSLLEITSVRRLGFSGLGPIVRR